MHRKTDTEKLKSWHWWLPAVRHRVREMHGITGIPMADYRAAYARGESVDAAVQSVLIARQYHYADAFWNRVQKSDGCWLWTGHRFRKLGNRGGYGQVRNLSGRATVAHRVSWVLTHGEIPSGLMVCHRCDNPPCVRPDHLFLGTNSDNMRDMAAKGRGHIPPSGCASRWASFGSPEQVQAILERLAAGEYQTTIARSFGVSPSLISLIARKKRYVQETSNATAAV
jgi:hypothetical protein